MLISLNEIKKLVKIPTDISTDEIVKTIGSRLVEVEGTEDLGPKYEGCYIAKVISCEAIPETHLHLCKIDAGEAGLEFAKDYAKNHPDEDLTTNENLVQVVCGAPNVHAGMFAVWIKPGAIVPETYGGENFELSIRKLRGYESYGMLAGADELALDTEHKYIAEIDPKGAIPGQPLAEKFDLNDTILDIENKSLTHRPDTFGLIGFAREVAGILGIKFEEPSIKFGNLNISFTSEDLESEIGDILAKKITKDSGHNIDVKVEDGKLHSTLCPYYSAYVFDVDNSNLESATATTKYLTDDAVFLAKAGMRSISKIVDATNVVMLKTGQPLHAFDFDKLVKVGNVKDKTGKLCASIHVRTANEGETLKLLDGKTIDLLPTDIVICSGETPIALAGAMGGESTEIDESTKTVVLESATFSLYNERKMQMAHGIFSEAITRFTKGQPVINAAPAAMYAASYLLDSPEKISSFSMSRSVETLNRITVKLTVKDINSLLGTSYDRDVIVNTLENVGFKVSTEGEHLAVLAPAWRTDIHIKEDIIEEVGRLLGFDNIEKVFPTRDFKAAERNPMLALKTEIRGIMSDKLNANELLTYSFVSRDLQEKVGEDPEDSYEIVNSISPELQRFRQSIVPSLLEKARDNAKAGYKDFTLYEFNQVTKKSLGLNDEKVPTMKWHIAAVTCGDFYQAKALLLALAKDLHMNIEVKEFKSGTAYYEPSHSAEVICGGKTLGVLGEFKNRVKKNLKLDSDIAGFELDLETILESSRDDHASFEISKFPSVERDLTVKTDKQFAEISGRIDNMLKKVPNLIYDLKPVSIYQAEGEETRNLSFHIVFASTEKTLETPEISAIMENIEKSVKELGAAVV